MDVLVSSPTFRTLLKSFHKRPLDCLTLSRTLSSTQLHRTEAEDKTSILLHFCSTTEELSQIAEALLMVRDMQPQEASIRCNFKSRRHSGTKDDQQPQTRVAMDTWSDVCPACGEASSSCSKAPPLTTQQKRERKRKRRTHTHRERNGGPNPKLVSGFAQVFRIEGLFRKRRPM